MAEPIWQLLSKLVKLDQNLLAVQREVEEKQATILKHEQSITKFHQTRESGLHAVHELKKAVHLLEQEIAVIDEKESAKKRALDTVHNHREYDAIKKELEVLAISRQDKENQLISKWHEREQAEERLKQEALPFETRVQEMRDAIAELQKEIAALHDKKAAIAHEEEEQFKVIPAEWQSRYRTMKGKVSNPIVPVVDEVCSVCFYHIMPQDLARLKKRAMLPCRSCYRFLYYDLDTEKDAHAASY